MTPLMPLTQEKYNRLINYLDRLLTPEEEMRFAEELNTDTELLKEFDFELLFRAGLAAAAPPEVSEAYPEFEPAAAHLEKAKKMLQPPYLQAAANRGAPVRRLVPHYKWVIAVAALFILVATALVYYFLSRQSGPLAHTKPPVKKEAAKQQKGPPVPQPRLQPDDRNDQIAIAEPLNAQQAFADYYGRYQATDEDPEQASRYYYAYHEDKNYREVLDAREADYQTKGAGDSLAYLYVGFYKALSWIETGRPGKAVTQLKALMQQTGTAATLRYSLQWYLVMAYLKTNHVTAAKKMLQEIVVPKNPSPYKARAARLLKALG